MGADGTAPGRVWESRLLPALITSDGGWGVGVPCVGAHAPHPFFCLFCYAGVRGAAKGGGVLQRVWGLCGVVDVADEFVLVLTITAAHVRFLCVAWTL